MTNPTLFTKRLAALERQVRGMAAAVQLSHSSIDDGHLGIRDGDGRLIGRIGKQPDDSSTVVIIDAPIPLQTTDPICEGLALAANITWDGNLIGPDGVVDAELAQFYTDEAVEVHLGATEGFFPSSDTMRGQIPARVGGTIEVGAPAGLWWVRLVVRNQAGQYGPPSASVPVEISTLVDQQQFEDLRDDLDEAALWIAESGVQLDTMLGGPDAIPEQAVNKLWAGVVRSRKITTDMLLVGPGTNLIPDPNFLDDELTAYRMSEGQGSWSLQTIGGLRYVVSNASTGANIPLAGSLEEEGRYVPVEPGQKYRLRVRAQVISGASWAPLRAIIRTKDANGVLTTPLSVAIGTIAVEPAFIEYEWEAPADAVAAEVEFSYAVFSSTSIALSVPSLTSATDASLIVDGAIKGRHVEAESVAAAVGEFIEVAAEQLRAGNIEVALNVGVNGSLRLGSTTGVHIIGQGNQITIYAPGDLHPDGTRGDPKPMTRMGGADGGSFTAFDPATSDELGGTRSDGTMFTPHLTAGAIEIAGAGDVLDLVGGVGRGMGNAYLTTSHSGYSAEVGLLGFEMRDLIAGHVYRISISMRGNLSDNSARAIMGLRATVNGSAPSVASPDLSTYGTLWPPDWSFANDTTGFTTQRYHEFTFVPNNDIARLRVYFTGRVNGAGTANTRTYVINLRYEGPQNEIGLYNAFVAPPSIPFDQTFRLSDHWTWTQYGQVTDSRWKPYFLRHGTGGTSNYRTYLQEPTAARNLINGGGVTDMWIELTHASDNGVSNPWFGTYTSLGGTISNPAQLSGAPTKPGESGWVKLTTAQMNAIIAGARPALGRTAGGTLASYYGTASGTVGYRPRIRIKGSQ